MSEYLDSLNFLSMGAGTQSKINDTITTNIAQIVIAYCLFAILKRASWWKGA